MNDKEKKALGELLFQKWLEENHPRYWWPLGIAIIVLGAMFVTSIVLMWVWDEWWKLTCTTIALTFLFKWVYKMRMGLLVDEYISEKFKNKR